jgi:hypothetical protein
LVTLNEEAYGGNHMDGNRRWFGWIAIGLGVLALLIALSGRGFGPQVVAGVGGADVRQAYPQQSTGPQLGVVAPGADAQQGAGRGQHGLRAPVAEARQDGGRPGRAGWWLGGLFGFPFKLFGGLSQLGTLLLLVGLGFLLLRGRQPRATAGVQPAGAPPRAAPEQRSPTGETYTEESDTDEPRDQA